MKTVFVPQWKNPGQPVILASNSPRRCEILTTMGISFSTQAPLVDDESSFLSIHDIEGSLRKLAEAKALSVAESRPEALILGADTIVVYDTEILGKPRHEHDARRMLKLLSGKAHVVYTGVALCSNTNNYCESTVAATTVYFRDIPDEEISMYIESGECMDKAGAYAIQGKAMIFVDKIEGCYYNVVGLPVVQTIALFNQYTIRKDLHNV
jgi:septum formation protein